MLKWTVYLMIPYATWEDVEAENETQAIEKCDINSIANVLPDSSEPSSWMAIERLENADE